jgi:hypothetical protein
MIKLNHLEVVYRDNELGRLLAGIKARVKAAVRKHNPKGLVPDTKRPPFGVWLGCLVETPRAVRPAFGRFGEGRTMLTHGSNCRRAWSGPFVTLVGSPGSHGRRGLGTAPKL